MDVMRMFYKLSSLLLFWIGPAVLPGLHSNSWIQVILLQLSLLNSWACSHVLLHLVNNIFMNSLFAFVYASPAKF
jgi:hypothetical protein